jgi:hypothetical protein
LFIAEFLLPCVWDIRGIGNTMNEASIWVEDEKDLFERIILLGRGSSFGVDINADSNDWMVILKICRELWNAKLFELVCESMDK